MLLALKSTNRLFIGSGRLGAQVSNMTAPLRNIWMNIGSATTHPGAAQSYLPIASRELVNTCCMHPALPVQFR